MSCFNTSIKEAMWPVATLAALLTLSACQTTPLTPVFQRENALYETTGIAETKSQAQQNALRAADKTCRRKQAIIVEDKFIYNGVLSPFTGRMITKVGTVVSSFMGTEAPKLARDDDYEYNIQFRCQ